MSCIPAGAEVMSLVNSDENKTFGVVLRTPVENSKGIPHILEHSVLCGSRKYPIKVPLATAQPLYGSSQATNCTEAFVEPPAR